MKNRILAFGEIVWDYLPGKRLIGGSPANFVFRSNTFGDVGHLVSKIGDDELGREAIKKLEEFNIKTKHIQVDEDFPTGEVEVDYDENGSVLYHVTPNVAYNHIELTADVLKLARKANCIVFNTLPLGYGISRNTIREIINQTEDIHIFFDLKIFHHFFNKDVIEEFLHYSTIVHLKERAIEKLAEELKISSTNIEEFTKEFIEKYKLDVVIVMRNNNSFYVLKKGKKPINSKIYSVDVKDIVGSGMAFSAGFLHFFLKDKKLKKAIEFGNAASALNSTFTGATHPYDKDDVLEFIKKN